MACADKLCGATACQGVQQMAVGGNFACALISDGTVRCWGANKYGQLGLGTADTTAHPTPAPVPGLTNVISIAAGTLHVCAVMSDHTLRCWGQNNDGELGIGTTDNTAHPTPMPVCATGSGASCVALTNVNKVAAGSFNTCAIVGQTVKCWGDNLSGQIGDGTDSRSTANNRPNPTQVCTGPTTCGSPIGSFNGGIVELVMGVYFACARDGQNVVYCWGANDSGECGATPNSPSQFDFPQTVNNIAVGAQKPIHLAAAGYSICAVVSDGNTASNLVRCWGFGGDGERGDSTTNTNQTPSSVCKQAGCGVLLTGATAVGGSNQNMCAVANGAVYCWGLNTAGQIGKGTVEPNTTKYTIATPSLITTGALDVSGEADAAGFCARLQTGGTLRCWGYNGDGECGNGGVVTPQSSPVAQSW
jgi:alpha-tubulin suppressor-like RCC1 family protein